LQAGRAGLVETDPARSIFSRSFGLFSSDFRFSTISTNFSGEPAGFILSYDYNRDGESLAAGNDGGERNRRSFFVPATGVSPPSSQTSP
jgi:hypothetical protein